MAGRTELVLLGCLSGLPRVWDLSSKRGILECFYSRVFSGHLKPNLLQNQGSII